MNTFNDYSSDEEDIVLEQTTMDMINDYSSDEEDIVLKPNIIVYHKNEVDMFTIIIVIVLFSLLSHMGIIIN